MTIPDILPKTKRPDVVSRIRGRGNEVKELRLMVVFRAHGITGWRRGAVLHWKVERGKLKPFRVHPDFIFRELKLAVFVDGCFWHGCPKHATKPASNRAFWRRKLSANKTRDRSSPSFDPTSRLVTRTLRQQSWRVLRVWEHELARKHEARLVGRLNRFLAA